MRPDLCCSLSLRSPAVSGCCLPRCRPRLCGLCVAAVCPSSMRVRSDAFLPVAVPACVRPCAWCTSVCPSVPPPPLAAPHPPLPPLLSSSSSSFSPPLLLDVMMYSCACVCMHAYAPARHAHAVCRNIGRLEGKRDAKVKELAAMVEASELELRELRARCVGAGRATGRGEQ